MKIIVQEVSLVVNVHYSLSDKKNTLLADKNVSKFKTWGAKAGKLESNPKKADSDNRGNNVLSCY